MPPPSAVKGAKFERLVLDYMRGEFGEHLTRPRAGANRDRGDVGGLPLWTFECKNMVNLQEAMSTGLRELRVEQDNAATPHGAVILKRRGTMDPTRQLFVMELGPAVPVIRKTLQQEGYW